MWNNIAIATRRLFRRPSPETNRLEALAQAENYGHLYTEETNKVDSLQDLVEKTATYAFQMQSERDAERRVRVVAQELIKSMGGTVGLHCYAVQIDLLNYMKRLICELPN